MFHIRIRGHSPIRASDAKINSPEWKLTHPHDKKEVTQEVQSAANEYIAYDSVWEIKINKAAKQNFLEKKKNRFFFLYSHFFSTFALAKPTHWQWPLVTGDWVSVM